MFKRAKMQFNPPCFHRFDVQTQLRWSCHPIWWKKDNLYDSVSDESLTNAVEMLKDVYRNPRISTSAGWNGEVTHTGNSENRLQNEELVKYGEKKHNSYALVLLESRF
ncbi:hypothetical protein AOLI_G00066590 [Acnodon oligacanthus]